MLQLCLVLTITFSQRIEYRKISCIKEQKNGQSVLNKFMTATSFRTAVHMAVHRAVCQFVKEANTNFMILFFNCVSSSPLRLVKELNTEKFVALGKTE